MTNRVDLYQAERKELTIPSGSAFVFIEGRLCPELEVVEVAQGERGEFGSARMRCRTDAAQFEDDIETGREVSIRWIYNALGPGAGAEGLVIFAGQVEAIEKATGPAGETFEVTARDFSATLERIMVFGRWVRDIGERVVFVGGLPMVFNENGGPNASDEEVEHKGNRVQLFAADSRGARMWDCAEVIRYLISEYVPAGEIAMPDEGRLRALAGGETVRDLDVTGMSLLDALVRCCGQAGLEFKFVPRLCESGPRQAIVFYRKGAGRAVELNLQQYGEWLSVSRTNIWKASSRGSFRPVTHRYMGEGDYKVFEATFEMIKGWPWYDESVDYEKYSPSTNAEFYKVKNTWRRWCLNEAGDYTDEPFGQGPAYDFSRVFGTADYAHRRRRFWPALSRDSQGRSFGYFLEVSYDAGAHWWQYPYAFENLLDECGMWLASDRLDIDTWIAAIKGVLKFRLTATVVSDERLSCTVADGPVGGFAPVVERVVEAGSKFRFRKVTGRSIFAGGSFDGEMVEPIDLGGGADEADDTAALNQFVRRKAQADSEAIETFDVQTPWLALGFEVGDVVETSPDDRDIFSLRCDNRSTAVIERVKMDFQKQTTEMKVVRRRE